MFTSASAKTASFGTKMPDQSTFEDYSSRTAGAVRDPWRELLVPYKKIKDAVHRSIWLTELEVSIIDTKEFQRLRYIKQTGPAFLLYPTAVHTRFDHSIGTVQIAQQMADSINKSSPIQLLVNRDIVVIRLVALLHDLVHLPFGHSLEDEGRLFDQKQWLSPIRQTVYFKPIAEVVKQKIVAAFNKAGRESSAASEADRTLEQLKNTLVAEEDGNVEGLDAPYVADIVGNTVCADLLDYVKRDLMFCGLSGGYDELIFFYMTLNEVQQKQRLVIRLFKPGKEDGGIRPDVLTALVDLLRLRYSIGERVYYHHTKREASGMLIKMVAACIKAQVLNEETLCELSDDSLLYYVRKLDPTTNDPTITVARKLENCFSGRLLYKPVFQLPIVDYENSPKVNELIKDWEKRYDTEEVLCELLGLDPGDIIIYVPSEKMGGKQAKALIQTPFQFDGGSEICTMSELAEKRLQDPNHQDVVGVLSSELDALENKHRVLWKLSVLIHPRLRKTPKANQLHSICEQWFKNRSQSDLIALLAESEKVPMTSMQISVIAGKVPTIVLSSDSVSKSLKESLLGRYSSTVRALLKANSKPSL